MFFGVISILLGYIISTLGALAFIILIGNEISNFRQDISGDYYFREYSYGAAFTSGGKIYSFYKKVPVLPFEKKIVSIKMHDWIYNFKGTKVGFQEYIDHYRIKIYSFNDIQIDTIIRKNPFLL
jgi:hypothetical protein